MPGAGQLTLPAGQVHLSFEEDGVVGENDSADMPDGLTVTVVSQAAGQIPVERLSSSLFSVSNDNTGHVPYGRLQVPTAGAYQVTTQVTGSSSAVSPRVTFGEPP